MSTKTITNLDLKYRGRDFLVKYGFILVTVISFVSFFSTQGTFRLSTTFFSMLKYTSVVAITGLGITLSMAVGGLDLSVGAVAGMAVTLSAMTMVVYNKPAIVAVALVILAGIIIGCLNALLIVVLKIPDLLATLASMFAIMGLKLVPVNGQSVSSGMMLSNGKTAPGKFTQGFLNIDGGKLGVLPYAVIIWFVLTLVIWIFLTRTIWGRAMYSVGSNPEAAHLAGIRVKWYRALAYIMSSTLAAISGLILASRIGQGDISAGNSLLLDSVAVALVGTSVLAIGKPNAWGTALGAFLMGVVITGLTIAGFPYYGQDVVKGSVLLLALVFSFTLSRKKSRFISAV
jgi:simple sugar transport system permease protein